jgi:GMP synthase-like glutamine amidotransferase
MNKKCIVVIDPAVKRAEVECFNDMVLFSPHPCTYHLPALQNANSLSTIESSIAGIVVLGSASSVNDELPWQKELAQWMLPKIREGIPTLGICFGHQFIGHLFGAKVKYWSPEKKKHHGFREIELKDNELLGKSEKGLVFVSHCEIVYTQPKELDILATSEEVAIEGFMHKTLPIWTLQSHPEANETFIKNSKYPGEIPAFGLDLGQKIVRTFLESLA